MAKMKKAPSNESWVICNICGRELLQSDGIRHHVDPQRKTKEPGALSRDDRREKKDLLFVCRTCHGVIHSKLQKSETYYDEFGKKRLRKVYYTDNPEGSIWL